MHNALLVPPESNPLLNLAGRFFEYNSATFIPWLRDLSAGRPILDVGCGLGFLTRDLLAAGHHRVLGIDFRNVVEGDAALLSHVHIDNVANMKLVRTSGKLLVIARPCHGAWVSELLDASLSDVLYIGKASNRERDTAGGRADRRSWQAPQRLDAPGMEPAYGGEPTEAWLFAAAWKWRDPYYLVRGDWLRRLTTTGRQSMSWTPEWSEDNGGALGTWVNYDGYAEPVRPEDTWEEGPIWATTDTALDWSRATWVQERMSRDIAWVKRERMWRPQAPPGGWLSPGGTFYACAYMEHYAAARYVVGWDGDDLEEMGWAYVFGPRLDRGEPAFWMSMRGGDGEPTEQQRAALYALNLECGCDPHAALEAAETDAASELEPSDGRILDGD